MERSDRIVHSLYASASLTIFILFVKMFFIQIDDPEQLIRGWGNFIMMGITYGSGACFLYYLSKLFKP